MAEKLGKWPPNRGLISKIRPSDGCRRDAVPLAVVRGCDLRKPGGHLGNVGLNECVSMGLKVEKIEADPALQDLILTVHHCYMHSLMNTSSFKMVENHLGVAFVKQQIVAQVNVSP